MDCPFPRSTRLGLVSQDEEDREKEDKNKRRKINKKVERKHYKKPIIKKIKI